MTLEPNDRSKVPISDPGRFRPDPPSAPDDWADLEALNDRAHFELSHRLDSEERLEGQEPW